MGHLQAVVIQLLYMVCSATREAVEHFLSAINLQKNSRGPQGEQSVMSDNIWTTMRMALTLMGNTELHTACDERNVDALNREFPSDT